MTSQIFEKELFQLDVTDDDDEDDQVREDEIKKLIEAGLGNETFDYGSDDASSRNVSKFSDHKDCSFVESVNNREDVTQSQVFQFSNNGDDSDRENENGGRGNRRINLLPHSNSKMPSPPVNGHGSAFAIHSPKVNGHGGGTPGSASSLAGGKGPVEPQSRINNGTFTLTPSPSRFLVERNQKNCETEEVEVQTPTVSLLHKDHCPKTNCDGVIGGDGVWQSAGNEVEQLKNMIGMKDRHIERSEDTIATLQKDKRALNHQIAIMKSEMIQTKSHFEEAVKYAQMKDDEVAYMQTKIQEAIKEYENAREDGTNARGEVNRLNVEMDKLREEIKCLRSLGASTQQAELSDTVRQIREKHALENASWQKVVNDLQGEIQTYKRSKELQLNHYRSAVPTSVGQADAEVQTDCIENNLEELRERELAILEFQEEFEFGGGVDGFFNELQNLPEREIIRRVRLEWQKEKDKLANHYLSEIKVYRDKLASLPRELYAAWNKTQDELGLNKPVVIKPVCRSVRIQTEHAEILDKCTSLSASMLDHFGMDLTLKDLRDQSIQVNSAAVLANSRHNSAIDPDKSKPPEETRDQISFSTEEKETSSTEVQTDETLETYRILASLIDSWAREVNVSKQRVQESDTKAKTAENELQSLNEKFRRLQKGVSLCRKEWRRQEEALKSSNAQLRIHYVEALKKLSDKVKEMEGSQ